MKVCLFLWFNPLITIPLTLVTWLVLYFDPSPLRTLPWFNECGSVPFSLCVGYQAYVATVLSLWPGLLSYLPGLFRLPGAGSSPKALLLVGPALRTAVPLGLLWAGYSPVPLVGVDRTIPAHWASGLGVEEPMLLVWGASLLAWLLTNVAYTASAQRAEWASQS